MAIITKTQTFKTRIIDIVLFLLTISSFSCKKIIEIPAPKKSITTSQVFADSADATAAVLGIYSRITYGPSGPDDISVCNGSETIFGGLSADELVPFDFSNPLYLDFYQNTLKSSNQNVYTYFWYPAYSDIYQTNACIEALLKSNLLTSVKNQLLGESKFLRALIYFYLVNFFGDVPNITSTNWEASSTNYRTSKDEVYKQIISDLQDAQKLLPANYLVSSGLRTRANQWAATALLARVYLYLGRWNDAIMQSSSLINNLGMFSLASDLNSVFSVNSTEAILQWKLNTSYVPNTATQIGLKFVTKNGETPQYYISDALMQSFETGDKRRALWVDSVLYGGSIYYFPYKYKIGNDDRSVNGTPTEFFTVLRLAEQYLIRAESEAQQNDLSDALKDINAIRTRAGLPILDVNLNQSQIFQAIAHERQIEFFAESGHRWLDLKRTNTIDAVMSIATPNKIGGSTWMSYQQLYPVPQAELSSDPKLTQNPGY